PYVSSRMGNPAAAPLPVRALPGVGYKTEKLLAEQLGVATAGDVRRYSQQLLADKLGDKSGALLWHLCRGQDPSAFRPTGPPRSITVEDSFKTCSSWQAATTVLRVLAPDLLQRLHDEYDETRRRPETLTLKWRQRGTGWSRSSASCAMPLPPGALAAPPSQTHVDLLVRSALQLLQKQIPEPFNLSLLNLGATNFKRDGWGGGASGGGGGGGGGGGSILDLFSRHSGRQVATAQKPGSTNLAFGSATAAKAATNAPVSCSDVLDEQPDEQLDEQLDEELDEQLDEELDEPDSEYCPDVWIVGDGVRDCLVAGGKEHHDVWQLREGAVSGGGACGGGSAAAISAAEARRAAEQSAFLRREYLVSDQAGGGSGVNAAPAILSKSRERLLREAAAAAGTGPCSFLSAGGARGSAIHRSRPPLLQPPATRQQPQQQQRWLQPEMAASSQQQGAERASKLVDTSDRTAVGAVHTIAVGVGVSPPAVSGATREPSLDPHVAKRARLDPQVLSGGVIGDTVLGQNPADRDAAVITYRVVDLYYEINKGVRPDAGEEDGDDGGEGEMERSYSSDGCNSSSDGGGIDFLPDGRDSYLQYASREVELGLPPRCGKSRDDLLLLPPIAASPVSDDPPWSAFGRGVPVTWDAPYSGHGGSGSGRIDRERCGGKMGLSAAGHRQDSRAKEQQQMRVFLHLDVDCFYCQVERLDDPSLVGVPLAVTQFNSGGFVSVSYEARAAGIRCGDGVGAGGRASIPYLKAMGAVSRAEAQRRCPGLVIRPMRTERYRRVAEQLHASLRRFAPDVLVEKTSYDDFYMDVTAACCGEGPTATRSWAGIETGQGPGARRLCADAARVRGSSLSGMAPGAGGASISFGRSCALPGRTSLQAPQEQSPEGAVTGGRREGLARSSAGERNPAEGPTSSGCGAAVVVVGGRGGGAGGSEAPTDPSRVGGLGLGLGLDSGGQGDDRPPGLHEMDSSEPCSGDGDGTALELCQNLDLDPDRGQDLGLLDRCALKDGGIQLNAPEGGVYEAHRQQPQQQRQNGQQAGRQQQHKQQQQLLGGQDQFGDINQQDAPPRVHVVGGGCWEVVEPWLRRGVGIAQQLRAALKEELSLTVSVGVGPTKLSARLAGPSHKPDGITVVPAARLREFMSGVRIKAVPTLARKTGDQIISDLGVERVGQLEAWSRSELVARFGPQL
ncbi:hypothetical protein VaNZ11_001423, partial [Volvox africanus]